MQATTTFFRSQHDRRSVAPTQRRARRLASSGPVASWSSAMTSLFVRRFNPAIETVHGCRSGDRMSIHRALPIGLCVFALSIASVAAADGPTGGIVAGANLSSARLSGSDANGIDPGKKTGLFIGAFVLWPMTQAVSIQPEVAYSQRHFSVKDTTSS